MQVKAGYKQTGAGVVPEDWDIVPLSELVTEFRGGAPLKPSDFTTTGIKVLSKGGVGRTGWLTIDDDDLQYCSPSYAAAHRNNQVDRGYTIVVLRDLVPSGPSIGLMVQIKEAETFVLAQGVYGFKVNQRADPGYLVQLSNTHWYRQLMNSIMVGSTQVHITNTAFKCVKLPLPKLAEQRAIAEALSDVDALIGTLDRLIAKRRDLKQAAMQQLLTGQKRLPGFSGEWTVKTLGDTCVFENGDRGTNYPSPASFAGSGIPFVNAGHVAEGRIDRGVMDYITKESYARLGSGKFKPSDILFCLRGSLGKFGVIDSDFGEGAIASSLVIVRARSGSLRSDYLSCYFNSELCTRMIEMWAGGAAQPNLGAQDLARFLIPLPPLPEQTAIAEVLSDMDAEIAALERRRDKTGALKQGMMQELLTGRVRLVKPEPTKTRAC
jgi:type I restriction enzyme S subunit